MRASAHLWADGPQPYELFVLQACRLYHCSPAELEKIPADVVMAHLAIVSIENKIANIGARRVK